MTPRLFFALSTNQVIANLLPILELAEAGDRVLWIESRTASRALWSAGALEVLAGQGVSGVDVVTLADDEPGSVYAALSGHPRLASAGSLHLVGNGGTKLQFVAALEALAGRLGSILYNNDRRCGLDRYLSGVSGPVAVTPYRRHRVDLPEVLRCRGMEIEPGSGARVWPGARLPDGLLGTDAAYTASRHEAAWRQGLAAQSWAPARPVAFDVVCELDPPAVERFKRSLSGAVRGRVENVRPGALSSLYHASFKLEQAGRRALSGSDFPPTGIGTELEQAVCARTVRWLEDQPDFHSIVQSVWRNVRVRARGEDKVSSELDVALVLKNGVVLHLECKTFDADVKDLDARLAALQRNSSLLATMGVCMPHYTGLPVAQWQRDLDQRREAVAAWPRFRIVPFTLIGQPERRSEDCAGEAPIVPSFESALGAWLQPFLVPATSPD